MLAASSPVERRQQLHLQPSLHQRQQRPWLQEAAAWGERGEAASASEVLAANMPATAKRECHRAEADQQQRRSLITAAKQRTQRTTAHLYGVLKGHALNHPPRPHIRCGRGQQARRQRPPHSTGLLQRLQDLRTGEAARGAAMQQQVRPEWLAGWLAARGGEGCMQASDAPSHPSFFTRPKNPTQRQRLPWRAGCPARGARRQSSLAGGWSSPRGSGEWRSRAGGRRG